MIKFRLTTSKNRQLIGFGLSHDNIERLKHGNPIHVHLEEVGISANIEILIFSGVDEATMEKDLRAGGLIQSETAVHNKRPPH